MADNKITPELKAFYDTELIENARPELIYAQFAKRLPLPLHHNGELEIRKWNTFERAAKLTEGVIPTGQKFGVATITSSVFVYENTVETDDSLELHAYDDVILSATEECGVDAAEVQERLIRDCLLTNTNVLYCDNVGVNGELFSVLQTPTSCREMRGAKSVQSKLTPAMVNKAVTILKKNRTPRINGRYYAVVHPSVAHDLRSCEGWIEAHKYAAPEELFNGEIGELHGVRFIEDASAPVLGGEEYRNMDGGVTYATYFFGCNAFGIADPDGGALETIIHDKRERGPLERKSLLGYRLETNGASIIYPERILRVMSCSNLSDTDEPNTDSCEDEFYSIYDLEEECRMNVLRGTDREDPNLFVCVNGVNFLLPKGKTSLVPGVVLEEVHRAARAEGVFNDLKERLSVSVISDS